MTRVKANEIVKYLLAQYEPTLKDPPMGWTYHELYDVKEETPTVQYADLYHKAKYELAQLGVQFRS
jgi:hypothetical protein